MNIKHKILIFSSSIFILGLIHASPFLNSYASIALVNYSDALADAKTMQKSINRLASNPNNRTLSEAKAAWLNARESYGQTEIFRLSNGPIDAEEGWVAKIYGAPEGQLNAWPLDERMIDYSTDAYGRKTQGNIIDTIGMFKPGGEEAKKVDTTQITADVLASLNENGGEANVATGYHAIEFLLWGQDQDYQNFIKDGITHGALVAGQRPLSDYTTDQNSNRRKDYLKATAALIVSDLQMMTDAWAANNKGNYRAALLGFHMDKSKNIASKEALKQIFSGMGVFIKSELANERIAVAVLTPSEEDEHSCFSDNTHRDIATNYQGFKNILLATYNSVDYGISPLDIASEKVKQKVMKLINSIDKKVATLDSIAKTSRHFDYQIRPDDPQAKEIRTLKNELRKLGDQMVIIAQENGVDLTKNDVTDSEETKIN